MGKISATAANRSFSRLLSDVRRGKAVDITVRGEVVARLVPVTSRDRRERESMQKSWEEFIEHLRNQPVLNIPRGTRDELYDE